MHDVRNLSISIARKPMEVYAFAADPLNLPLWAAGLAQSQVRRDGEAWVAQAPFGPVRIKFAERNTFGVMDHDVILESGSIFHNPMRVVPNGEGSELLFTLIRRPGMSEEALEKDRAAIDADLKTLKRLLEQGPLRSNDAAT